ncbi:MAG: CBS domain-containing protein, partial [Candidatus Hodarchaeales archaeon]
FKISNIKTPIKKETIKFPYLKSPTLHDLAELFVDKNVDLIPLVDNSNKVTHVVSTKKLALKLLEQTEIDIDSIIEPFSNKIIISDSIEHIFPLIRKFDFDILPIFEENKGNEIVGVLPIKSLTKYLYETESGALGDFKGERKKLSSNIEAFMLSPTSKYSINQKSLTSGSNLVELMIDNELNTILVTNEKNQLIGLVSLKMILKKIIYDYMKTSSKYTLRILGAPDNNIEEIAFRKVNTLLDRYHEFFGPKTEPEGNIRFRKIEHQSKAGMYSYETEIRVSFGKGKAENFSISATDWGAEKSLNKTFNKLSRLLSDKRKIARDYQRESPRTTG